MMTTAPYMGQLINGEVVTKTSMVTTSNITANRRMTIIHLIALVQILEPQQGPITTSKIIHHLKYISIKVINIQGSHPMTIAI